MDCSEKKKFVKKWYTLLLALSSQIWKMKIKSNRDNTDGHLGLRKHHLGLFASNDFFHCLSSPIASGAAWFIVGNRLWPAKMVMYMIKNMSNIIFSYLECIYKTKFSWLYNKNKSPFLFKEWTPIKFLYKCTQVNCNRMGTSNFF